MTSNFVCTCAYFCECVCSQPFCNMMCFFCFLSLSLVSFIQGCSPPVDMVHCPGQTDNEYRTEFSLWCLMAAPLLVDTDVRNMTDIMKEVCRTLFNASIRVTIGGVLCTKPLFPYRFVVCKCDTCCV